MNREGVAYIVADGSQGDYETVTYDGGSISVTAVNTSHKVIHLIGGRIYSITLWRMLFTSHGCTKIRCMMLVADQGPDSSSPRQRLLPTTTLPKSRDQKLP